MAFQITSSAFTHNSGIPSKYTCDGDNVSPPLAWSGAPSGTKSFALIMDDPDAPVGTWDHWILFNLPSSTASLSEAVKSLPAGTLEGKNGWGKTGYGGPCPPSGEHRYFFKIYALDTTLGLKNGATKREIEAAMKEHILAQAELVGRYSRSR